MDQEPSALLLADLGFGDAGKGLVSDYLCRARGSRLIVRYCGGPNAGHNVVTPDGRHATLVQVGSGAFVPGVKTFLSSFMLINPLMLEFEVTQLRRKGAPLEWSNLIVSVDAQVITTLHAAVNRIREEARGSAALGSTGQGVSEAVRQLRSGAVVLTMGDLDAPASLAMKLAATRDWALAELDAISVNLGREPWRRYAPHFGDDTLADYRSDLRRIASHGYLRVAQNDVGSLLANGRVIFEGSQGVLLDPVVGFVPHTTSTRTTFVNAFAILNDASFSGNLERVAVMRTYSTRHGRGPLVSESPALSERLNEMHNQANPDQGKFRVGHLDVVALRYALDVLGGADWGFITHCDTIPHDHRRLCLSYSSLRRDAIDQRFFHHEDDRITDIRATTREEQEQRELTDALHELAPNLSPVYAEDEFLVRVEEALGLPMRRGSRGPTAADVFERRSSLRTRSESDAGRSTGPRSTFGWIDEAI